MSQARDASRYRELLRTSQWFRSLPDAFADALVREAVVRSMASGSMILRSGEPPSGLHALVEGAARIVRTGLDGSEHLHVLVAPPTWLGEVELIDGMATALDVIAEQDVVVLHVGPSTLEALLAQHPAWWRDVARLATDRVRRATAGLDDLSRSPPGTRLARRILWMTGGYGDWQRRKLRVIDVRQAQLADMVNVSRQKLNRLLGELAARGVVRVAYGHIEVLDEGALRAAAEFDRFGV